ncbi:MAG: iron-sulfur cluster assembly protein [Egibacteraceae bacterium]
MLAALAEVRDPELDEAITELGFVAGVEAADTTVRVRLRLPTYFCAPNFSYLMVADARRAVRALPGVCHVEVALDDHFAAAQINAGVAAGSGFEDSFPGLADDDLDDLRRQFRRKALLARQHRLCAPLLEDGRSPAELAGMRLGDLQTGPETVAYRRPRAELGLAAGPDAPLLVDIEGHAVAPDAAAAHLRRCRTVAVSIEGNAVFCRGLLATRYATQSLEEQP